MIKTIRAYWLGLTECHEVYGTPMLSVEEIDAYNKGRRLGFVFSFSRPNR